MTMSPAENKAVFLSYASQDAAAVRRIAEALRAAGVEVWFDQNELVGGDAWDAKIRKQIAGCALFVPVISAATQARGEGYFRLEWKLAVDRSHLMAHDQPFLLPVVVDDTTDSAARVPPEFRAVQWTRLPGGATPDKFCERVMALLTGNEAVIANSGAPAQSAPSATHGAGSGRTRPAAIKSFRPWLAPALIAAVLVAGLALWQSWKKSAPGPLTEAQLLVAKAQNVLREGDEMKRDTYVFAEEFLLRAESLDPSEASAWVLHSRLSFLSYTFFADHSATRREALRVQADRVGRLLPGSLEARLAATYTRYAFQQFAGLEEELEALAKEFPQNWQVLQLLGRAYARNGKVARSLACYEQALQLLPDDPMLKSDVITAFLNAERFAECQSVLARALQGRTNSRLLGLATYLELLWGGNLAAATAAIEGWPAWFLLEDRGAAYATLVALWRKDNSKALAIVGRFPRDYLREFIFTGPRAVLSAWAHEQAGNATSAQADWRTALQVVERELKSAPDEPAALHWKAWALARLGEAAPAAAAYAQLTENNAHIAGLSHVAGGFGGLALALGRKDEALAQIAKVRPDPARNIRSVTRTVLRLNPLFDPLRDDPRFQALVAAAPGPSSDEGAKAPEKSVAVLAFKNVGRDPANDALVDGIGLELIAVLGRVQGLTVRGSSSLEFSKTTKATAQEKGRQLAATYLVDGSVQRAGDTVKITASVTHAATNKNEVTWGPLKRDVKDFFAVQEEIAGLIAQALSLKLTAGSAASTAEVNPQAFELYLQGRQAWNRRTLEDYQRAEVLFTRAIDLDPKFARAYVGRADARTFLAVRRGQAGTWGQRNAPQLAQVAEDLEQVLKMDPDLAEAHASLGNLHNYRGKREEGQRSLERAIALNANYPTAHQWLGLHFWREGRLSEARASALRAVAADPLSSVINAACAVVLQEFGDTAAALVHAERAVALQPDSWRAVAAKSAALWAVGRKEEAVTVARSVEESNPSSQGLGRALLVLGRAGLTAEIESKRNVSGGLANLVRLQGAVAMGRWDEFFSNWGPNMLTVDDPWFLYAPELDAVRGDPRFLSVLKEAGLDEAHTRVQAWRKAHPPEKVELKK